jgi:hypothetical protein
MTSISFKNPAYKRLVYLFGVEQHSILINQQIKLLDSANAGVKERDMEIVVVKADNKLYQQYRVPTNQFCLILIGKDADEKFRSYSIVTPEQLFVLIDGMPIRKSEMKRH